VAEPLSNASGGGAASGAAASSAGRASASPGREHATKAAQVAARTLKEGDKGGHSSGPKLGED